MSAEEKQTIVACIRLELDAFVRDLADRPPSDIAGQNDVRVQWRWRLHNALMAAQELKAK